MTENNNNRSDRADRLRRMREQRTTTDPSDEPAEDDQPDAEDDTGETTVASDESESPGDTEGHAEQTNQGESQAQSEEEKQDNDPGDRAGEALADETGEHSPEQPEAPEDRDDQPPAGEQATDAGEDEPASEEDPAAEDEDTHESYQVIEFELGEDRYGVDITRADEVLAYREVTRVPNTPDLIRGVVDIRGQIITVIDPTTVFNPRGHANGDGLIVVFEVDLVDGSELIGWAVDNVLSVHTVDQGEIVEPPEDGTTVEAALEREDGYLTLTTPESLLAATGRFDAKIGEGSDPELNASG